ncbi:MAG TPA: cold shock domain-containing protein [bacterium]|nr:cold shock domain-containing protein [bacterium]
MPSGSIKWFSERRHYGFIVAESGQEVFFHESEVSAEDMPVHKGDQVIFKLIETSRGVQGKEIFKLPSPL